MGLPEAEAVEREHTYKGGGVSWDSFFRQFPEVIFRTYGSVLPNIVVELILAFAVGWLAYFVAGDLEVSSSGHQLFGFLLGFLIVFRTQAGFNLYVEGIGCLGNVVGSLHTLAAEVLSSAASRVNDDEPLLHAEVLDDTVRHMKLFYYSVVEHLRSNDSFVDWEGARRMVEKHASEAELAEMREEFGQPTNGRTKHKVPQDVASTFAEEFEEELFAVSAANSADRFWTELRHTAYDASGRTDWTTESFGLSRADIGALEQVAAQLQGADGSRGGVRDRPASTTGFADHPRELATSSPLPERFSRRTASVQALAAAASSKIATAATAATAAANSRRGNGRSSLGGRASALGTRGSISHGSRKVKRKAEASEHDPTNAKPLAVLMWLKHDLRVLEALGAVEYGTSVEIANAMNMLVDGYKGMCKIDKLVLPLPYCQLLKIFTLFFVFSVPFVLAPTVGLFTPWISLFLAAGYFGLDHVGAELECPYGVDDNDLPLLAIGLDLSQDIDALRRVAMRLIKRRRCAKRSLVSRQPKHGSDDALSDEKRAAPSAPVVLADSAPAAPAALAAPPPMAAAPEQASGDAVLRAETAGVRFGSLGSLLGGGAPCRV